MSASRAHAAALLAAAACGVLTGVPWTQAAPSPTASISSGPAVVQQGAEDDSVETSGHGDAPEQPDPLLKTSVPPGPPSRPYLLDRLAAGASLGYFTANRARILSEMHLDFPFLVVREKSLYVRGRFETSTVKTGPRFRADSFRAQDIDYLAEVGARDYLNNRIAIAAFLGRQGRKQLDQSGSGKVSYLGLGFESAGFPRPGAERFEWRLALGAVFGSDQVEANAVARGAILYDVWRGERSSIGIDGSFDSLFDGLHGQTEYRVGPRWTFPLSNGIRVNAFAEWIRGRNPLLLSGAQGWNFGFRYTEGAYAGPHQQPLPDVRGVLSMGRGRRRGFGRFDLDLASPELTVFSKPARLYANLDANAIVGPETDNLYYIATVGLEAALLPRVLIGPAIYHRSNHTLGQGPTHAANLNIVQISARTPGWDYANRSEGQLLPDPGDSWLDRLEASFVPGVVTNSNFSDARSWDVQAGARLDLSSRAGRIVPFVRAFAEWGDVDRREVGAGFSTRQNLLLELRYRRDSQYFGDDRSDVYLEGSLYF